MADGTTYGIDFPFRDSKRGDYLSLTQFESEEIKADLIHLLLTRKGSRYFLPEFGTRLYEFIFEPFDGLTFSAIESDIRDSVMVILMMDTWG
jgi:phage baseplate assembly protein W